MWKDFFYYSKSERRAIYVLALLIAVFIVGSFVLPYHVKRVEEVTETEAEEREVLIERVRLQEERRYTERYTKPKERKVVLKEFDPNLADSIELSALGLPPFMVRNVLKYRAKGGTFATPEAFSRIYGMTEERFATLRPYIRISEAFVRKPDTVRVSASVVMKDTFPQIIKYPEGTLVDVGIADTTELKKIPGIGTGIAKAVVAYRNRLGGFYTLEQLREVEYITPEMMKWFTLEEAPIRKLDINKAGLDKLRAHPYLNFYQAKVIVEHRRKRGDIKSLSQLSLYEEFTEKDLNRLAVYFNFD
ncbi:MAG: helix-hairpin-helix domain-containing protein [Bacteroides sp.]|nr:helix-hairpin-helix domain-containing protein [Bacteroides sp.]